MPTSLQPSTPPDSVTTSALEFLFPSQAPRCSRQACSSLSAVNAPPRPTRTFLENDGANSRRHQLAPLWGLLSDESERTSAALRPVARTVSGRHVLPMRS